MKARRKRLEKYCNAINCDTLVTFEPENLFYMTGFWGEAIGILEKGGKTKIIAPELEVERAGWEPELLVSAETGRIRRQLDSEREPSCKEHTPGDQQQSRDRLDRSSVSGLVPGHERIDAGRGGLIVFCPGIRKTGTWRGR